MLSTLPLLHLDEFDSEELEPFADSVVQYKLEGKDIGTIAALLQVSRAQVVSTLAQPVVQAALAHQLAEQRTGVVAAVERGLGRLLQQVVAQLNTPDICIEDLVKLSKILCDVKKLGLVQERIGFEMQAQTENARRKHLAKQLYSLADITTTEQALVWDTQTRALVSGATPVTVAVLNSTAVNKNSSTDGTPEGFFAEMNAADNGDSGGKS
jgi:hypothetical protein